MKKSQGITLIALIVTIIVLLILAGVSLNLISGTNGILTRAEIAVEANSKAMAKEDIELIIAEIQMGDYESGNVMTLTTLSDGTGNNDLEDNSRIDNVNYSGSGNLEGEYDSRDGKRYSFTVSEDFVVTIEGLASATSHRVSYNANGGTENVPDSVRVETGTNVSVVFDNDYLPSKVSYNFIGWSENSNWKTAEDGVLYTSTGTTSFEMGSSNVTLYAIWEFNQTYASQHPEIHIPTGFHYLTGTVSTGYVITDDNTNDEINNGNEFVWIPVQSSNLYVQNTASTNYAFSEIYGDKLGVTNILGVEVENALDATLPEAEIVNGAGGFWCR